jgi:hypothetical protein
MRINDLRRRDRYFFAAASVPRQVFVVIAQTPCSSYRPSAPRFE